MIWINLSQKDCFRFSENESNDFILWVERAGRKPVADLGQEAFGLDGPSWDLCLIELMSISVN